MKAFPFEGAPSTARLAPRLARLVADDYFTLSATSRSTITCHRFNFAFKRWGGFARNRPPKIVSIAVYPDISGRLRDYSHQIEPSGRHLFGRSDPSPGFAFHLLLNVGFSFSLLPESMNAYIIHCRDSSALQTMRPFVILSAKIGDEDAHADSPPGRRDCLKADATASDSPKTAFPSAGSQCAGTRKSRRRWDRERPAGPRRSRGSSPYARRAHPLG